MIVDFPPVLQHQVQTILTIQRQRSPLSASSLFVEDLPEMGQRQGQTEKIQKTQGQIAETFSVHPRRSRSLSRYHEFFRDWADRPEIQKTVKMPRPEGQTRPSEVRALRVRQDPAWSEPKGPDKTQRGQSPEGQTRPSEVGAQRAQTRPSEVSGQRARQDPARSEP